MRMRTLLCGLVLGTGLVAASAYGDSLYPAGKTSNLRGAVEVKQPGSSAFNALSDGKAYGYGSIFRAGKNGAVTISLSNGTSVELGANALVKLTRSASNPNSIVIAVMDGKMQLQVQDGFESSGNAIEILWRGGNLTVARGGTYLFDSASEADLRVLAVTIDSGELTLSGPDHEVESLPAGSGVSVASNKDQTFIRIRCFDGNFAITVMDEERNPRVVEMETGSVIKILRKMSSTTEAIIATVLEINPDNVVVRANTYTTGIKDDRSRFLREDILKQQVDNKNTDSNIASDDAPTGSGEEGPGTEPSAPETLEVAQAEDETDGEGEELFGAGDDEEDLFISTTTTTTTTTTTIPDVTPTGNF